RVEGTRTVQLGPLSLRDEPRTQGMEKRARLAGASASGEQLGEVGDCAQLEEPRVLRVRDGDCEPEIRFRVVQRAAPARALAPQAIELGQMPRLPALLDEHHALGD